MTRHSVNNNTRGSWYISLFKFKSFDQFNTPQTASNFRHLLSCGTIESKNRFTPAVTQAAKGKPGNFLNCHTACELGLIRLRVNHIDNEPAGTPQAPPHTTTPSQLVRQINPESPTFIQDVLHKYRNLWKDGRIGKLKDFEVKLHVDPSVQPVIQPQRRIPFHFRQKVDAELDKLEKQGIIEPVTGPTLWVSPIVVIPKLNSDDVRRCVDMRSPNNCIKRERHPTPTADELISSLHGAKIFSKIDLNAGYHQLSSAEESRHLTTFSTHRGLHRYTRLNFGTNSAAEQFQQAIQQTLSGIPGVMNISDDIIIFGADETAHKRCNNVLPD